MDTLIDQFELKQIGRFRDIVNADDVVGILYHHWVLCDDYYPEERQANLVRDNGHLLFIYHGASRYHCLVKLLLLAE